VDRDLAREKEAQWSSRAREYDRDDLEIVVVDDIKGPDIPDLSDWGDPSRVGLVEFEATQFEAKWGERFCNLAIFFYKYWKIPFFRRFGDWCATRAFWFTDGQIPVGDPGRRRDVQYLTGRHRT